VLAMVVVVELLMAVVVEEVLKKLWVNMFENRIVLL
jgi:hypothetical protein